MKSATKTRSRKASTKPTTVLGLRALNRALLERQMLRVRETLPPRDAVERLVGMQAQAPNTPYIGLWSRLESFRPEGLSKLLVDRKVVRIALMRSTIHLVSDTDCLAFRPLVQSVHERGFKGAYGKRVEGVDLDAVAAAGRKLVEAKPRTFAELGELLEKKWSGRDPAALANAVRTRVPLVQLPPRGVWGASGLAVHTSAEHWLGRELDSGFTLDALVLRYLAAFGPAGARDVQAWSGLTRLGEVLERLRPQLQVFNDEDGNELFDLPESPRPDADVPAPPLFLPEYDNVIFAYADRRRIVADAHRPLTFNENSGRATFLIDGFVAGAWKLERSRRAATLLIEPFAPLRKKDRAGLEAEGELLLAFAAAEAETREIRFVAG